MESNEHLKRHLQKSKTHYKTMTKMQRKTIINELKDVKKMLEVRRT